jgi:hypothetical protein
MGDELLIGLGVLDEAGFTIAAGCGAALLLLVLSSRFASAASRCSSSAWCYVQH